MPLVPVDYAGWEHWDRCGALINGKVRPEGLDFNYIVLSAGDIGRRWFVNSEFDAGETWSMSFIAGKARGEEKRIGLPVFPSRNFRHGYIYVRSDAGINEPKDLIGKRMGVDEYVITAAVWARAILEHEYGVPPASMQWYVYPYRMHAAVEPSNVKLNMTNGQKTLEQMLLDGELDGLISAIRPRSILTGDPRVRRLFPNYRELERDYFKRTGFFPIMHMVSIQPELYERHRWVPNALMNAFEESKAAGKKRMEDTGGLAVGLPWLSDDMEEMNGLFGADAFPYGYEANLPMLEAMTQYVYEQGLAPRKIDPEELFAPETLNTSRPF
jgi:4,5-dihydroxyphthalate decarboxylase